MICKPEIYIWTKAYGECPVTFLPEYIYFQDVANKNITNYTYCDKPIHVKRKEIIKNFNCIITDNFKVHTRTIDIDTPVPEHVNIILVPCVDFTMLLHSISSITRRVYEFCEKHNIKICFNYVRECVTAPQQEKINEYIEKFYLKKGYDKKYIKIFNNSFKPTDNIYFINTNLFDKFLYKKNISRQRKQYNFLQKRKYKFSTLFGLLHDRSHRVDFLCKCKEKNLIDDSYFYSVICTDYKNTHRFVQTQLLPEKYNMVKDLIYHKVYSSEGNILDNHVHIYNDGHEYDIPSQINDSYINIVLETSTDTPSITEKIYKPILCGVPFIWLGYKGISNFLLDCGYKLYSFINYDFDKGETTDIRINLLIEEILRLNNIDLEYHINNTKHVAMHNANNFLMQQYASNDIYRQLKKI